MTTEKSGIKIVKIPPESKLTLFSENPRTRIRTNLLWEGLKVYPEGSDEGVEIGSGDLVVFPKGMNCTWDVSETVDKHYNFE
ncbi:hypothetical protein L1987_66396 [Smallanthus sonchifolius]|uniref:Uncharacterized protein n=1 Tax=Smallanthus sonchifolius TaxID=185202 RepID=A0ACB9BX55_9ASTR|nr:hypothetical protein L1987_66396 [Smallanthus sonchifolius]